MDSAVSTFIGFKQTDIQLNKLYIYLFISVETQESSYLYIDVYIYVYNVLNMFL